MNKRLLLLCLGLSLHGCNGDNIEFLNSSNQLETSDIYMQIIADVRQRTNDQNESEDYTALQVNFMGQHRDGYFFSIELNDDDSVSASVDGAPSTLVKQVFPDRGDPMAVRYAQDYTTTDAAAVYSVVLDRERDAETHEVDFNLPQETPFSVSGEETGIELQEAVLVEWSPLADTDYDLRLAYSCEYDNDTINFHLHYPNPDEPELSSPFTFIPGDYLDSTEGLSDCTLTTSLTGSMYQEITDSAFAQQEILTSRRQAITRSLLLQ